MVLGHGYVFLVYWLGYWFDSRFLDRVLALCRLMVLGHGVMVYADSRSYGFRP